MSVTGGISFLMDKGRLLAPPEPVGGKEDDGCMPDTYGVKQDELMNLMWRYWEARQGSVSAAPPTLEPF